MKFFFGNAKKPILKNISDYLLIILVTEGKN